MRHAQRLDDVLDRDRTAERVLEAALATLGREEVVQLLVEAEAGDAVPRRRAAVWRCAKAH
jgi:hypothetical protein